MPGPMPPGQKRAGPVDPGAAARLCPPSPLGIHLWCEPRDDLGAPTGLFSSPHCHPYTRCGGPVKASDDARPVPTSESRRPRSPVLVVSALCAAHTGAGLSPHASVGHLQHPPPPGLSPLQGSAGQAPPHLQASLQ